MEHHHTAIHYFFSELDLKLSVSWFTQTVIILTELDPMF